MVELDLNAAEDCDVIAAALVELLAMKQIANAVEHFGC